MLLVLVPLSPAEDREPDKVRILLLGDSTVIGSICRRQAPKADHLEDIIRKLLVAEGDLPPAEVLNQGRDGEYVHGVLQGRYDKDIAKLPRIDLVLIRYGLNDRGRRKDFATNFPGDLKELIHRLQKDHAGCQVVLEKVIPTSSPDGNKAINDLIRQVAKEEKLPLLDTHARFAVELEHVSFSVLGMPIGDFTMARIGDSSRNSRANSRFAVSCRKEGYTREPTQGLHKGQYRLSPPMRGP
jgi:lysophospholipase L1-like esterase